MKLGPSMTEVFGRSSGRAGEGILGVLSDSRTLEIEEVGNGTTSEGDEGQKGASPLVAKPMVPDNAMRTSRMEL